MTDICIAGLHPRRKSQNLRPSYLGQVIAAAT